ncbi:hypothetical protein Tco_0470755 [Tanacetum coccineum]
MIQDGRVDIQTKNAGYGGNVDNNADSEPSYDAKAVSEVNASNKVHEQVNHAKCKPIIHTSDDDQIDSNIIFDDPYVENNEVENKKRLNNELKRQKELLQKELETFKDQVKTFESKTIQCSKYKETCEELEREIRADKETIERILKEKDKVRSDLFKIENEKLIVHQETQLAKKAFKERENRYLDDICDLEFMILFLKAGLGYKNPERLKKAIAAQLKMYHGEMLHSTNLKIDSPDSEETLEDAKESRLKMRNKMIQLNYGKLNALYETFVPQQEPSVEETYFLFPSTSNDCSESKDVTLDLPIPKMPKESKLLKMFEKIGLAINDLRKRIDVTLLEDRKRRWMSDSQNSLREFYKTDVVLISDSLSTNLKELQQELIDEKNEMLRNELEKSSSDSKDIQANLLKRIKILENDFKRSQAQSIDFELKLQHQKEKMACDVS